MKRSPLLLLTAALALAAAALPAGAAEKIRVLVVSGGHAFEQPQFFKMFEENAEKRLQSMTKEVRSAGPHPLG